MELKFILESILFSAQHPLSPKELRDVLAGAAEHGDDANVKALKKTSFEAISTALEQLAREHEEAQRSYRLVCVAESWQFVSQPEFAPWIKALVGHKSRPPRLSHPALETLAIISYRQPITRAEIEQVRGVAVDGVMQTLLERGLVEAVGRAEVIGRPITYGTTAAFLQYFGLKNLDDLPAAEELRRIVVQKPEALLTVDPGLATAPPEQLTIQDSTDPSVATEAPASAVDSSPALAEPAAVEAEPAPKSRFGRRQPKPEAS
jgi:segregation and condensation protein B